MRDERFLDCQTQADIEENFKRAGKLVNSCAGIEEVTLNRSLGEITGGKIVLITGEAIDINIVDVEPM